MDGGGVSEVTAFLSKLGLEQCVQAVVHNGFYTSMEALRGATYEELVDSGVRPGHAKLILGHLNSSGGLSASLGPIAEAAGAAGGAAEVAAFLRSVGLEACEGALSEAGYASVEALGRATLKELVAVGIKPVHARLIVSNLDSASSLAGATPAGRRNGSFDEESLLGGPRKRRTPTRLYALAAFGVLLLLGGYMLRGSGGEKPSQAVGGAPVGGGHGRGGAATAAAAAAGGASHTHKLGKSGGASREPRAKGKGGGSGGADAAPAPA